MYNINLTLNRLVAAVSRWNCKIKMYDFQKLVIFKLL